MIYYEIVFCTKYRRKIFENKDFQDAFTDLAMKKCEELQIKLTRINYGTNYVHLFIESNSRYSPDSIAQKIKSVTAVLKDEFDETKKLSSLWTRNNLIATHPLEACDIVDYITDQAVKRKTVKHFSEGK